MKAYIAIAQPFSPAGDGYFVTTIVFEDVVDRLDKLNSTLYIEGLDERYPPGFSVKIESRPDLLGVLAEKARAGGCYADGVVLLERQLPGAELRVLAARLLRLRSMLHPMD